MPHDPDEQPRLKIANTRALEVVQEGMSFASEQSPSEAMSVSDELSCPDIGSDGKVLATDEECSFLFSLPSHQFLFHYQEWADQVRVRYEEPVLLRGLPHYMANELQYPT